MIMVEGAGWIGWSISDGGFATTPTTKHQPELPEESSSPASMVTGGLSFLSAARSFFFSSVLAWLLLRQSLVCNDCDDAETTMMMMNTLMRLFLFLFCRAGKGKAKRFLMKPHDARQKVGKRGWDFLPT
jgi:hypothetical protein